MCIAILCKAGTQLPKGDAEESHAMNRNGGGFAYVDEHGKVVAKKGFFAFDKFWEAYEEAFKAYGKDSPFLVHFRIATAGKICDENCHPFILKEGNAALIHNGMLWSGSMHDALSDTAKFAKETADLLSDSERMNVGMVSSISKIVGATNKIVLLYADRTFKIINEDGYGAHWNTDKTIWYSNGTYRRYNQHSYTRGNAASGGNYRWQDGVRSNGTSVVN